MSAAVGAGMEDRRPLVAVVGAGMAGLAAAHELRRRGADVVVLEQQDQVGGRVRTATVDGVPVDVGAQFVGTFYDRTLAAARTCGADADLRRRAQSAAVLHHGTAHPISPVGVLRLLGARGLVRAVPLAVPALVAAVTRRRGEGTDLTALADDDVGSAAELARHRAGPGATELLVAPLLRALLYWDLPTTSRALLLLLLRTAPHALTVHRAATGLQGLPVALADGLDVRLGHEVTALGPRGDRWHLLTTGGPLRADAVVCAVPADRAARLLQDACPQAARLLRRTTFSRTVVVTFRVPDPVPDGALLLPPSASRLVAGATTVPGSGGRLVRVFTSDEGARRWDHLPDDALGDVVRRAASAAGCPVRAGATRHVQRWDPALPRFAPGDLRDRVVPLSRPGALPDGLALAGDHLGGPYLEGAVASGERAARRLLPGPTSSSRRRQVREADG